jgi:RNA polymerase sigma-70 factor, ECF subfamily
MDGSETTERVEAVSRLSNALLDELWRSSGAAEFGLDSAAFASILERIVAKYLSRGQDPSSFCRSLRLKELALARACAAGNERAWNIFLSQYRERLYGSALAIAREESAARELADSVYAELYGLHAPAGHRVSKLAYYDGRGSLDNWLRSVLAHEFADCHRRERHQVSLEEQVEAGREFAAHEDLSPHSPDPDLGRVTDEALAATSAEERLLLASYYLDGQTLAEIAIMLGVHESTVSRRLERTVRAIRKNILRGLRRRGLSRGQAREALEVDVRDLAVDVCRYLGAARKDTGAVLSTDTKE